MAGLGVFAGQLPAQARCRVSHTHTKGVCEAHQRRLEVDWGSLGLVDLQGSGQHRKYDRQLKENSSTSERRTTFQVCLHVLDPGHPARAAGKSTPDLHKSRPEGSLTGGEHVFKELALAKLGREGLADLD